MKDLWSVNSEDMTVLERCAVCDWQHAVGFDELLGAS